MLFRSKSYTAGLYLLKTALDRAGTSSVYIGLTRDQAKRIVWNDVFKSIIKKYNLPAKYNETELTITLENGSIIYVLGVGVLTLTVIVTFLVALGVFV